MTTTTNPLPESQRGPAERLLSTIITGGAHLWHHRPGLNQNGTWVTAQGRTVPPGQLMPPGIFAPAAVALYRQLLEIYQLNQELGARFACYAMLETEWNDLKVVCAALMLVQARAGEPVKNTAQQVEFHDDDFRAVGQGMLLYYDKKSKRHMRPKDIRRVAEVLELPEIASLNRTNHFGGDPLSTRAPLGRWPRAATAWLRIREQSGPLFEGLTKGGLKTEIIGLAKKIQYKPLSQRFYELLNWRQKQSSKGHRKLVGEMTLQKTERFDGMSEADICAKIVKEKLNFKAVVGRLPEKPGLTPAIMAACLPSLSDKDLRLMTPMLEELGLLAVPQVRARWEKAIATATDHRVLNVAKNVQSVELKEKLVEAADNATKAAVAQASVEAEFDVFALIDISGSMEGAIDQSQRVLSRILPGFGLDRVHVATFNTMGTHVKIKAASEAGVKQALGRLTAGGGTMHYMGVRALHQAGVRVPEGRHLIVLVFGDEAENGGGPLLAETFKQMGYQVGAIGHVVTTSSNPRFQRGLAVRDCARLLGVPYTEVAVERFDDADPYHVPRVLRALLEAPLLAATAPSPSRPAAAPRASLVERVMRTPLLGPDGRIVKETP